MARRYVVEVNHGGGWQLSSGPYDTYGEAEDAMDRTKSRDSQGFNENAQRFRQELGEAAAQYAGQIQSIREREIGKPYRVRAIST